MDSKSLWAGVIDSNSKSSVHRSLQIKEQTVVSDGAWFHPSLIGFTHLKCNYKSRFPQSELYFFVKERATGSKFLLSLSINEKKNRSMLRDLYANHFELKEEFLLRDSNHTYKFYPSQRSPLGITVWKGRVVRWYRTESETEANQTIEQISSLEIQLYTDIRDRDQLFVFVRHLMDLEKTSLGDPKNDITHYAQGRQHMVDWMVEIVECFGLGDLTIFQAMRLFDRFLMSHDRVVKTSSLQLFAGACLLIASKFNNIIVTEKDICFCCDNIFSVANVIATEELVLKHLEWKLACPSSIEFLFAFLKILGIEKDTRTTSLCSYILELSLMFPTTLKYPPSITAASSMVLAFYCFKNDTLWPDTLSNNTGLELKDLAESCVSLSQEIEGARLPTTNRLDMIHRRYNKPCRHNAAQEPIPILTSKTTLMDYEERLRSRKQNL